VSTGCGGAGPGIAIPKKGGLHDFAALQACVARLKRSAPDFESETQVFISGNPDTDYQTIVSVIDAIRTDANGDELFPDVNFKVSK
jgi:biopolymer transport protein ExbD